MAAPMRDGSVEGGHRPRVADPRTTAKASDPAASNFEYDDNEWDIGIGDLIIDLDADIEKTNEGAGGHHQSMSSSGAGGTASGGANASSGGGKTAQSAAAAAAAQAAKMAIEHSATVDKGLKMKIKRTKPGTKTSEAKHEIVKSNEQQNGNAEGATVNTNDQTSLGKNSKHQPATLTPATTPNSNAANANKRGSSGHRRDKTTRGEKHTPITNQDKPTLPVPKPAATAVQTPPSTNPNPQTDASVNGVVRVGSAPATPQRPTTPQQQRVVFPASSGPGPPAPSAAPNAPGPPPSPAAATAAGSAAKPEQTKVAAVVIMPSPANEDRCSSPPPAKKMKPNNSEPKSMLDVCVGTSVGTITEPDCLGPCEPGTSVTLEGIVWHETEGGVLVVNVTWRGKTYVGTLLDCTRHDWAPPRFCDSPTSDLDARTPKGRGKRGRAAASTTPSNDLSNFTETRSSVHSKLRNGGGKGRRGGTTAGATPGPATGTSSPTPFIPPRPEPSNKRKSRTGEEEPSTPTTGKKTRVAAAPIAPVISGSPPASPVLLECPEPNCSKKYKHINGLKYHQSHAHGSPDDDDTKDAITSMSENDESNIEAPSPVTPVKSPEKVVEAPVTPVKKEEVVPVAVVVPVVTVEINSQPDTPRSTPPSPQTPQHVVPTPEPPVVTPPVPIVDPKSVVKPGVLRFGPQEDFPVGAFTGTKPPTSSVSLPNNVSNLTTVRAVSVTIAPSQPSQQVENQIQTQTFPVQLSTQVSQPQMPPNPQIQQIQPQQIQPQQILPQQIQPQQIQPQQIQPQQIQAQQIQPQQIQPQQIQPQQILPQPLQLQPQVLQPQPQQISGHPQQIPPHHQVQQQQQQQQQQPQVQHQPVQHQILNHTMQPQHAQQQPAQVIPSQAQQNKLPQFKVKPTAALMPEDKKDRNKPQNYKKKNRKSPAGSPHPHPQPEQPVFGLDQSGREEVQSPAYSDISDDAAPVLESEVGDKNKIVTDKKVEPGQTLPHSMPQYGMYPFYGQPPYLVPSVQQQVQENKQKEGEKVVDKSVEKEAKKDGPDYQQKMLPQHYYPYGYVPGYTYNMEPSYGAVSMVPEDKIKEERMKESPSPAEHNNKPAAPIPNPIQVPTPGKVKAEPALKEKHQNENHQILKESIEMKSQMSPYMYSRQSQQQPAHINHHHHSQSQHNQQREEDMRRYYLYPDQQRRKEQQPQPEPQKNVTPNKPPQQSPSINKHKEKVPEEKKEKEVKQEGVKPTMETQGPPPPPTSQYAYIHPSYMQSPHYGTLPFDPNHPMYRSMLVPGPYSGNPYLHPQIPRYHAPEDLSRPPQGPTKALDLLQHHANQYYTSHKIHELQERAMKSPTPKTSVASASPSSVSGPPPSQPQGPQQGGPPTSQAPGGPPQTGNKTPVDKESRSPPPQRHVHTHHHTHVGLGYPLYPAPYGAAVLASQQAAAVTVINPYPPK